MILLHYSVTYAPIARGIYLRSHGDYLQVTRLLDPLFCR